MNVIEFLEKEVTRGDRLRVTPGLPDLEYVPFADSSRCGQEILQQTLVVH
jgi:hypothetical protein